MPAMSAALRDDYRRLFDTCQIRRENQREIDATATAILANRPRYAAVGDPLSVPWYVVGVIHSLECGLSFAKHLHNGDPLIARTKMVPAGRPAAGSPPFAWDVSATDALTVEGYAGWTDWSVPGILFKWESYNGMGYRKFHPEVKSPYLWSFTNQYTQGKYRSDGVFDPALKSKQAGAAAILRRLAERGAVDPPVPPSATVAPAGAESLLYAPSVVTPGGAELQHDLNGFPNIFLREDGPLGERTSDAFRLVFGRHLKGDPRGA